MWFGSSGALAPGLIDYTWWWLDHNFPFLPSKISAVICCRFRLVGLWLGDQRNQPVTDVIEVMHRAFTSLWSAPLCRLPPVDDWHWRKMRILRLRARINETALSSEHIIGVHSVVWKRAFRVLLVQLQLFSAVSCLQKIKILENFKIKLNIFFEKKSILCIVTFQLGFCHHYIVWDS